MWCYNVLKTPTVLLDTYGGLFFPRLRQKCFQPSSIIAAVSLSKALSSVSSDLPSRFDTRRALLRLRYALGRACSGVIILCVLFVGGYWLGVSSLMEKGYTQDRHIARSPHIHSYYPIREADKAVTGSHFRPNIPARLRHTLDIYGRWFSQRWFGAVPDWKKSVFS